MRSLALVFLLSLLAAPAAAADARKVIVLDFAPTNAKPETAELVTRLTTVILDEAGGFEVIASRDIQDRLRLEASKEALGCDAMSDACMAEIAGALGAELVFGGTVGELGGDLIVTLGLFDSDAGRSLSRKRMQLSDRATLNGRLSGLVGELVRDARGEQADAAPLFWTGVAVGGVGLVAAAITGALAASDYAVLTAPTSTGPEKERALGSGLGLVVATTALGIVAVSGASTAILFGGE